MFLEQPKPPLVKQLSSDVERWKKVLEKGSVPRGLLEINVHYLRHTLKAILGDVPAIKQALPDIPEGISPAQSVSMLKATVKGTEVFIAGLAPLLFTAYSASEGRIFIGHGRSPVWREFKDFLAERLRLPWDEFNRDPVAGLTTSERLSEMLASASFALLIMTAEDEHADKSLHARENVIHEVGLFQGKLGLRRAIVLLEEGCAEFTNIGGLIQIRFPRGRPEAAFEGIRRVLEREGFLQP